MQKIKHQLKKGLTAFKKNKKLLPVHVGLDIIFVILFTTIFMNIQFKIVTILATVSEQAQNIDTDNVLEALASQQVISEQLNEVFLLVMLLIVSLFIVWSLFQGTQFAIIKRKPKYLLEFFGYSAIVTVVTVLAFYLFTKFSAFNKLTLLQLIPQGLIDLVMFALLFGIGYLAFWLVSRKSVLLYVILSGGFIGLFLINLLMFFMLETSVFALIPLGILPVFVLLPYVAYVRYVMMN